VLLCASVNELCSLLGTELLVKEAHAWSSYMP
jgi:hypothetical protein